jgi:hypothetical protein
MQWHKPLALVAVLAFALLAAGGVMAQDPEGNPDSAAAEPLGTAFSYQGRLQVSDSPYTGACDFQFGLWDTLSGGTQIGGTLTKTNVSVSQGYFTVALDFGAGRFQGDGRWLGIQVRCPASSGSYTPLAPRQELTASPYALYSKAAPWMGLSGVPAGFADGTDNDTTYSAGAGLTLSGTTLSADTAYLQRRVSGTCPTGNAIRVVAEGGTVTCEPVGGGSSGWSLTGNAGTLGTNFLGTTDNVPLELKVNGQQALRLEPNATSPNLIGGYSGNTVTTGVVGATIGGGGMSGNLNRVTDHGGTVGGGVGNRAGDDNGMPEDKACATVGGGSNNIAGEFATVPGGESNTASGVWSFAAGHNAKALHPGTFVWADSPSPGGDFSSTDANQFLVRASNGVKIVRGASTFSTSYAALQVDQGSNAEAAWFYTTDAVNTHAVLKVLKQPAAPGNFIDGAEWNGTVETRKFHVNPDGTYTAGSDFAEALPAAGGKGSYEPGDVLVLSATQPGAVEKCARPYDNTVIGVYSSRPGFLGADKNGATEVRADDIPVAVLGIVPVKVSAENGAIQPGDLLTTSSMPGRAMRCERLDLCFGRTLGKALEALPAGRSAGVIRVLVTLQ